MRRGHTDCIENGGEDLRAPGKLRGPVLHEAMPKNQPERNRSPASYRRSIQESKAIESLFQRFTGGIHLPNCSLVRSRSGRSTLKTIPDGISALSQHHYDVITSQLLQTCRRIFESLCLPDLWPSLDQSQCLHSTSFSDPVLLLEHQSREFRDITWLRYDVIISRWLQDSENSCI